MSISEITHYLVNDDNPATSTTETLDWYRCSALHNHILHLGYYGSNYTPTSLDTQSWWSFHGELAEAIAEFLSSSLVQFLKHAQIGPDINSHSFFYYVNGLALPNTLWMNHDAGTSGTGGDMLTLYIANGLASHPDGLNFDQKANDCILQMSTIDRLTTTNGTQPWYPLETVLSIWISMITSSKIQAVDADTFNAYNGPNQKPWIMVPWSEAQLLDTLSAWESLVEAIESRISSLKSETDLLHGPVEDSVFSSSDHFRNSFISAFLTRARRPRFEFIAPALSIPSSETLTTSQPFTLPSASPEDNEKSLPPLILFQLPGITPQAPLNPDEPPFYYPYNALPLPCGLYVLPSASSGYSNPFADTCKLLLPFSLKSSFFSLYQPGYRFFAEQYAARLEHVFDSWRWMIEDGNWAVDENGVVGNVELWREAEDEEIGWKFQVQADRW